MFLFRGRKTATRKLHSPTVSLHFMQCFFFIAYARFFESFAYFLFNELHNIDTVIWCIHYKRFSVLLVFIGCIWLHSLLFWMHGWLLFFRSRKPARKLRTQTVSYTLGLKFQILENWDSLPRSFHCFERDHLVKSTFITSSIGCPKCLDDKPAFWRQMSNIYIYIFLIFTSGYKIFSCYMKTSVNIAYYTVFVLKVVINCMIKPGQVVLSVTVVNSMENEFYSSL